MSEVTRSVPNPFRGKEWPASLREGAEALWNFHLALLDSAGGERQADDFDGDASRLRSGKGISVVEPGIVNRAVDICRKYDLDVDELANQVEAAGILHGSEVRFENYDELRTFMRKWAVAHGILLAGLADVRYSWQVPLVVEVCRAFFITGRLAELPDDLKRNRLFIPLEELNAADVSVDQLKEGRVDEKMKQLIWKQIVRARDAMARGEQLPNDLSGRLERAFKRWWFGCLEILNEIERRSYDVWSRPIHLKARQKIQVRFQARFGRTTFRSK